MTDAWATQLLDLAWPVVVIFAVLLFRRPLLRRIDDLVKVKIFGNEFEWKQLEGKVRDGLDAPRGPGLPSHVSPSAAWLDQAVDWAPVVAVTQAGLLLEEQLRDRLEAEATVAQDADFDSLVTQAKSLSLIGDAEGEALQHLKELLGMAKASPDGISVDQARRFLDLYRVFDYRFSLQRILGCLISGVGDIRSRDVRNVIVQGRLHELLHSCRRPALSNVHLRQVGTTLVVLGATGEAVRLARDIDNRQEVANLAVVGMRVLLDRGAPVTEVRQWLDDLRPCLGDNQVRRVTQQMQRHGLAPWGEWIERYAALAPEQPSI